MSTVELRRFEDYVQDGLCLAAEKCEVELRAASLRHDLARAKEIKELLEARMWLSVCAETGPDGKLKYSNDKGREAALAELKAAGAPGVDYVLPQVGDTPGQVWTYRAILNEIARLEFLKTEADLQAELLGRRVDANDYLVEGVLGGLIPVLVTKPPVGTLATPAA